MRNPLENSIQSVDESRVARDGDAGLDLAELRVVSTVTVNGIIFDTGIHQRQDDRDGHADGRDDTHGADMVECSRQRHQD